MTTVASGRCTSAPAFVDTAIGKKPKAAAVAVSNTARKRSVAPLVMSSFLSIIPCFFNSLKCSSITIPLSTAIPKSAIKPTPAEILNGIPRNHNKKIPPTAESGIAVKINKASLTDLKAKYNIIKIKSNATGTAIFKRAVAL